MNVVFCHTIHYRHTYIIHTRRQFIQRYARANKYKHKQMHSWCYSAWWSDNGWNSRDISAPLSCFRTLQLNVLHFLSFTTPNSFRTLLSQNCKLTHGNLMVSMVPTTYTYISLLQHVVYYIRVKAGLLFASKVIYELFVLVNVYWLHFICKRIQLFSTHVRVTNDLVLEDTVGSRK